MGVATPAEKICVVPMYDVALCRWSL